MPTDIAAGAGALWLGNGGGESGNYTVSISRIDPRTSAVTNTVKLPDRTGNAAIATFNWGRPDIVVGAGAVWALNPDHTVSRIDPETGRLVATIDVEAGSIAADDEGVWVASGSAVTRIDPRTNRVGRTIRLAVEDASGIAVGAGKVWVSAQRDGVVWQIEPGPQPVTRSIAVGVGVEYIAFGAGAVWAGNYIDGTVSRIDPRTNGVTRVPVGAVQALAAGAGGAWVSTAGRPAAGTLPASVCGELVSGGRKPDVLIASDLPLQGPNGAGPRAMADAIRLALEQRDFKAGRYTVGYRSCDESTAQTGGFENRRCAANAEAYAGADDLVALIGPYSSFCAAGGDPDPEPRTRRAARDDQPDEHGPRASPAAGRRRRRRKGRAGGVLPDRRSATTSGCRPATTFREPPSRSWRSASRWSGSTCCTTARASGRGCSPTRSGARQRRLGVGLAGSAAFDPRTKSYRVLADTVARSGADGVVVGGDPSYGGDRLVKALRARLGARVTLMGGFFFTPSAVRQAHRPGRSRHVRDDGRPAARRPPAGCRRPALQARHRRPGHAVHGRDGGRAGRGSRDGRDRSLRRDACLGAATSCSPAM